MKTAETVVTASKWASLIGHVKANRVEYLVCVAILHMMGVFTRVQDEVGGVCI